MELDLYKDIACVASVYDKQDPNCRLIFKLDRLMLD